MIDVLLVLAILACALQALRARSLIASALWLAGVSAVLATLLFRMGAAQIAVMELSIGAGLVTVLFVFAISVAGEEAITALPVVPRPVALLLTSAAVLLLGWLALPIEITPTPGIEPGFQTMFWRQRGLDALAQIVLLFAGSITLLGLLSEKYAPLESSAAREVAARRDQELEALEQQMMPQEQEPV